MILAIDTLRGKHNIHAYTLMILLVVLWPLPTRIEQPRSYLKILLNSLWYMTVLNVNESQLMYLLCQPVRIINNLCMALVTQ
jgi:hypothetical protein